MSSADANVDFVMMRTFAAAREQVFASMTQAEHLKHWWGPQGCGIEVLRDEPRPDGVFHYRMRFAPGVEAYGCFNWKELAAPERLVYTDGFADETGQYVRHPMAPSWPVVTRHTVTLQEIDGGTQMTLVSTPVDASESERQTFKAGHALLQQGFGGMYDVYEGYLASL